MIWILFPVAIFVLLYAFTNAYAVLRGETELYELGEIAQMKKDADAILVLGAGVRGDHTPSHMLEDRLLTALKLYESGISDTVIVSGDHGQTDYDEVNVMKSYLIERGIPSDRIFMDHAGFSTYDSLYRAEAIFGARRLVLVTQKYHAHRALMIGAHLGLECEAVAAPILSSSATAYGGQGWYSFRESFARTKDFFTSLFRPEPKFLGDPIPLSESGDRTNDR